MVFESKLETQLSTSCVCTGRSVNPAESVNVVRSIRGSNSEYFLALRPFRPSVSFPVSIENFNYVHAPFLSCKDGENGLLNLIYLVICGRDWVTMLQIGGCRSSFGLGRIVVSVWVANLSFIMGSMQDSDVQTQTFGIGLFKGSLRFAILCMTTPNGFAQNCVSSIHLIIIPHEN